MAERVKTKENSTVFKQLKPYLQMLVRDTFGSDNHTVSVIAVENGVQVLFTHHHAPATYGPDAIINHVADTVRDTGIFPADMVYPGGLISSPSFFLHGDIGEITALAKLNDPRRFSASQANGQSR